MKNKKVKDEYLVYTNPKDNTDYYYKNGQLHREEGPAILVENDKHLYSNLSDKKLYKQITGVLTEEMTETVSERNWNEEIKTYQRPIYYWSSRYYLDNKEYKKEEFYSLMLEKELNKDLKNKPAKKLKL